MAVLTSMAQRTASRDAAELDETAVAGALDDTAVMSGYYRVNQVAAKARRRTSRCVLFGAGASAVDDDVRH